MGSQDKKRVRDRCIARARGNLSNGTCSLPYGYSWDVELISGLEAAVTVRYVELAFSIPSF